MLEYRICSARYTTVTLPLPHRYTTVHHRYTTVTLPFNDRYTTVLCRFHVCFMFSRQPVHFRFFHVPRKVHVRHRTGTQPHNRCRAVTELFYVRFMSDRCDVFYTPDQFRVRFVSVSCPFYVRCMPDSCPFHVRYKTTTQPFQFHVRLGTLSRPFHTRYKTFT